MAGKKPASRKVAPSNKGGKGKVGGAGGKKSNATVAPKPKY